MTLKVEICDESKAQLFLNDLKLQIEDFKSDLETMKETKKGSGYVSWEYKEDKKAVKRLIKSLEMTYDFYGGNI